MLVVQALTLQVAVVRYMHYYKQKERKVWGLYEYPDTAAVDRIGLIGHLWHIIILWPC